MQLFHGSSLAVENPVILTNGFYKDFGYGFYCTGLEKQAQKWALQKKGRHCVNVYSYRVNPSLQTLQFPQMSDEWLDFVAANRLGRKHPYDIVEGPMADDQIWDYVEDYVSGEISRAAFWELVKFKYPTHQITFCTAAAPKTLEFERSYTL